jgi:site-specific DNA-methyltransferase (adenine-specific)
LTSIVKRFGKEGSAPAQFGTDGVFSRHSGGFMGQQWDGGDVAFRPETWKAIGDCLLPGAYLLAFGGTRTWHRLAVAIEDAGFEIRDTVMWVYGSGFPKSHDVSKAIDRQAEVDRDVIGLSENSRNPHNRDNKIDGGFAMGDIHITSPSTDMAKTWDGYGSALKPAFEPIIIARKSLDGTIAQNCVQYGSGALNIDGCRVEGEVPSVPMPLGGTGNIYGFKNGTGRNGEMSTPSSLGRWPANLIHDGSDEVLEGFPYNKGTTRQPTGHGILDPNTGWNDNSMIDKTIRGFDDEGSSARFFYTAKVSPSERNAGLDKNTHPTLKPIALTEYLAKLILPPVEYAPRRILVPFSGAGSEMIGAYQAGWDEIVGVELSPEYAEIAEKRLKYWTSIPKQLELK